MNSDSGSRAKRQDRNGLGPEDGRTAPAEGHRPNSGATQEIINRLKEEPVARLVYDGMRWAAEHAENRSPPPWVEGGNATAQGEARLIARAILSTLTNLTPSGVERTTAAELRDALAECDGAEVNPSNYDHDDVCLLNDRYCALFEVAERAIAALALPSEPPSQGDVEGRAREAK